MFPFTWLSDRYLIQNATRALHLSHWQLGGRQADLWPTSITHPYAHFRMQLHSVLSLPIWSFALFPSSRYTSIFPIYSLSWRDLKRMLKRYLEWVELCFILMETACECLDLRTRSSSLKHLFKTTENKCVQRFGCFFFVGAGDRCSELGCEGGVTSTDSGDSGGWQWWQ
jgi:hypothetical protein